MTDGAQTRKICYKGKNGDMKAEETNIEYIEELTDIREYTKAEGFLFNTATTELKGKITFEVKLRLKNKRDKSSTGKKQTCCTSILEIAPSST